MSQTERLYRLKGLLDSGRTLKRDEVLRTLEISEATLKRDIAYLRDRLGVPISYDRMSRGWRVRSAKGPGRENRELPGLWMSEREIHALMTIQHILTDLDAGDLLAPHVEPLLGRLNNLLEAGSEAPRELPRRIRMHPVASRRVAPASFQALGSALLRRRRVMVLYRSRSRNEELRRELSPQRLVYYRDNWYLIAWCHRRLALRTFAVDSVLAVDGIALPAIEVSEDDVDRTLNSGYGIFGGREVEWATLRFSPRSARWVASERWHPSQEGRLEPDGCWLLRLPFSDPRELAMDVLRHIPEVRVIGPASLADLVNHRIREAATHVN